MKRTRPASPVCVVSGWLVVAGAMTRQLIDHRKRSCEGGKLRGGKPHEFHEFGSGKAEGGRRKAEG